MDTLTALIVDDEVHARGNLQMMLGDYCPEIQVLDTAGSANEAKEKIRELKPQVVFLDIRMPSGSEGFQILEDVQEEQFMVVFVTAFKDYAIRAFNANAIHYVLKPIDIEELQTAVSKLLKNHRMIRQQPGQFSNYLETLEHLSVSLQSEKPYQRITISHSKGLHVVDPEEILRLEGDGNCTRIYFSDGNKFLDTRTLRVYEDILDPSRFFRTHKSHIINLRFLKEYLHEENGHQAILKDRSVVPIARGRLQAFLAIVRNL